ncbi:esterase [Pigmentiphaga litoralis]|nr:esterase [Pigmentiphaga litoralis]
MGWMTVPLNDAERESEYSPSSCIGGNYAPFLQAYADLSAQALGRHAVRRDLAYGVDAAQRLDLFLPAHDDGAVAAAAARPALLVFIHGGYWQELSKDQSLFAAPGALAAGAAFAALDYTLAPHATVHDMVIECRTALRWLHAHADEFGYDASRIVVAGSSAGAHLAAMTGLRSWADDADLPAGVPSAALLVSGVYDLAPLIGTSINDALSLSPSDIPAISPLHLSAHGAPPAVVCWGEVETREFKRQSQAYADVLAAAGSLTNRFEIPDRNHFDVIIDLTTPGTLLGDACLSWLRAPR